MQLTHLIPFLCSEGLPTEETGNTLKRLLAEWKGAACYLEEVARKMQYQDEINIYFSELSQLSKSVSEKEAWLQDNSTVVEHQPLAVLQELCQVSLTTLVHKIQLFMFDL